MAHLSLITTTVSGSYKQLQITVNTYTDQTSYVIYIKSPTTYLILKMQVRSAAKQTSISNL